MPSFQPWMLAVLYTIIGSNLSWAQHQSLELEPQNTQYTTAELLTSRSFPPLEDGPFYTVAVLWETKPESATELEISFQSTDLTWSEWQLLSPDPHHTFLENRHLSSLLFVPANSAHYRLRAANPEVISRIRVDFYNPGHSDHNPSPAVVNPDRTFCPCPQPAFSGRLDWCPDGTCPIDPTPFFTEVTHLIVHHSAGSNTSSDWAARVRSIWDFHVNSNGWDDIGYNWLIDPNGVIYEGRPDNFQGAHFCGTNGGTMGVCMIGTYSDILPTDEAVNSLKKLLAWKSCQESIDPLDFSFHGSSGLNLFHISGHRDGCATECPGNTFYPTIPDVRDSVQYYIDNECSAVPGPSQLAAFTPNGQEVTLSWVDNAPDEDGFLIERSPGGQNNFVQVGTVGADVITFNESVAVDAVGLDYRIRSFNSTDTSFYSNIATVTYLSSVNTRPTLGEWDLFPIPVQNSLQVKWTHAYTGPLRWMVMDPLGQTAWQRSTQKTSPEWSGTLDLEGLSPGMYFLILQIADQTISHKIIIE